MHGITLTPFHLYIHTITVGVNNHWIGIMQSVEICPKKPTVSGSGLLIHGTSVQFVKRHFGYLFGKLLFSIARFPRYFLTKSLRIIQYYFYVSFVLLKYVDVKIYLTAARFQVLDCIAILGNLPCG